MRFSIAAAFALATGVIASPYPQGGTAGVGNDVTIGKAGDTCGEDFELSCCNSVDQTGDSTNAASGLLAGALQGVLAGGELGLFNGCSKLSVTARK